MSPALKPHVTSKKLDPCSDDRVKTYTTLKSISSKPLWFNICGQVVDSFLSKVEGRGWDVFGPQPKEAAQPTKAGLSIYENMHHFVQSQNLSASLNYLNNVNQVMSGDSKWQKTTHFVVLSMLIRSASNMLEEEQKAAAKAFVKSTLEEVEEPESAADEICPCGGEWISSHGLCEECLEEAQRQAKDKNEADAKADEEAGKWYDAEDIDDLKYVEPGDLLRIIGSSVIYEISHWGRGVEMYIQRPGKKDSMMCINPDSVSEFKYVGKMV